MNEFSRTRRVAEEIQRTIAKALVQDAADPRLRKVMISAVEISGDLQHARIFWLPLATEAAGEREQRRLQRALNSATGFLRGHLGRSMALKHVPRIEFLHDDAVEKGREMEELLAQVRDESNTD